MQFAIFESPFGPLTLVAGETGLRRLYFPRRAPSLDEREQDPERLTQAIQQLDEYFRGERTRFELPLELQGTPFQQRVWQALQAIPYGATTTYGALARHLACQTPAGAPGAKPEPRAVGAAVGATPVPIVIPCHRVIGSDGSLTGYGGGLHRKRALLDLEAAGGDRGAFDAAWHQQQLALL